MLGVKNLEGPPHQGAAWEADALLGLQHPAARDLQRGPGGKGSADKRGFRSQGESVPGGQGEATGMLRHAERSEDKAEEVLGVSCKSPRGPGQLDERGFRGRVGASSQGLKNGRKRKGGDSGGRFFAAGRLCKGHRVWYCCRNLASVHWSRNAETEFWVKEKKNSFSCFAR